MDLDKLFGISAEKRAAMKQSQWLPPSGCTHTHFRVSETGQMEMIVNECVKAHRWAIDIANVKGITTPETVAARRKKILSYVPEGKEFDVKVTPLINDNTDPKVWLQAWDRSNDDCDIPGVKVFWQGVSNDYGNSISNAAAIKEFVRSTTGKLVYKKKPMLITLHAECLNDYDGNVIPIKDREYWCMKNEVTKMVEYNPEGRYVIRHVSDYRTLEIIGELRAKGIDIHAEISWQYCILIDDSIFTGDDGHAALQCNCVFWPRPKDNRSRTALQKAALTGEQWLHFGQDYAMHLEDPTQEQGVKINNKGIAVGGLNFLPRAAKSSMIDFFVSHNKVNSLVNLMSKNGAELYDMPLTLQSEEYVREDWQVPNHLHGTDSNGKEVKSACFEDWQVPNHLHGTDSNGKEVKSACFLAGKTMHWQPAQA